MGSTWTIQSQSSISRFPDGLRVLVVNYNSAWLKDLETTLRRCDYRGTVCTSCKEALDLLKEKKLEFDIVLCGLNKPNIEELEFLEQVAEQTDLPVIGISNDEDIKTMVSNYAKHTINCLLGPATEKALMAIWQHAYRRRLKLKAKDHHRNLENPITNTIKKKQKLIWAGKLQNGFLRAVNEIVMEKGEVTPKKILEKMNVPGITRDHVASHLQKYKEHLKRDQMGTSSTARPERTMLTRNHNACIDHGSSSAVKKDMFCRYCRCQEVSMVLMPCRHLCLCKDCIDFCLLCPVCEIVISSRLEVCLS